MNLSIKLPLSYGLNKTGLPLITAEIDNQSLCFLLDTGSNKNLLDKRVYEFFKDQSKHVGSSTTFGLDGKVTEMPKIKLSFNIDKYTYSTNFNVFDSSASFGMIEKETDIQIHGILGNEFFMEHDWIIDFEKLIVYSPSKEDKIS